MPVVHLTAVDTLQGQTLADDVVHIHGDGLVAQAQQADLTAGAHHAQHLVEGMAVAGHFQTHVEAFHDVQLLHHSGQVFLAGVDSSVNAHLASQLQAVLVQVGDDNTAGACVLADASGHNADGAGAGDQHVFAHQIPHQSGVGGIAESVKEGNHIFVQILVDGDDIGGGDTQVLCESTVAVDAHAKGVLTPLNVAVVAVAAVAAGDMALAADTLANGKAGDTLAQGSDLAHILVADGHTWLDMLGSPIVPLIDVDIGATDGGLMDLDQNFAGTNLGDGDLCQS